MNVALKISVFFLLCGAALVFNAATSLAARKIRGRSAEVGFYRVQEQQSPAALRIGTLLIVVAGTTSLVLWGLSLAR